METNWQIFENGALIVMAIVVLLVILDDISRWRTSKRNASDSTRCPTCGHSAQTAIEENMPTVSPFKSPARRSLNPYREIRRLKQEVADAVACRDETQRLLEMQYVSMVEVVKAVNYMSTTGIAIQTKVGKA